VTVWHLTASEAERWPCTVWVLV